MDSEIFVGRLEELKELNVLLKKKSASLIVIKGRRRIGKSRLIDEFTAGKRVYKFVGLTPDDDITAQIQRDTFAAQLSELTGLPKLTVDDWATLFTLLAREVHTGRVIVVFDEISWMGSEDPTFLPKLKIAWDEQFKRNPKLMMIICGSVSTWIDKYILNSKEFYGRISWEMTLESLPLTHCNALLEAQGFKGSAYEKFKVLSVTGGVPWYLEHIQGEYTADDNIKRLGFTKGSLFVREFDRIFKDIFGSRDAVYKKIVSVLVAGPCEYSDLAEKVGYKSSGRFSEYLDNLIKARFVSRDYTWYLKSGEESRISYYRLCDNYIRFYLKYIRPKRNNIDSGRFKAIALSSLPGLESMLGLQFENLVLNYREKILELLNIRPEDVIADNPFIQTSTSMQQGCQIDYLIQTKYKNLYLCEIRFKRKPIAGEVIKNVKEKMARLVKPQGTAILPVLIHVNGVSNAVSEADFFYRVIDFGELLTE